MPYLENFYKTEFFISDIVLIFRGDQVVLNFHSKLYSPEKLYYNQILLFWDSKIVFHIIYKRKFGSEVFI